MEKSKQDKLFEKCLKTVDPYTLGYTAGVMDVLKRIPTEKEIEEEVMMLSSLSVKANVATAMANWIIEKMTKE